MTITLDLAPAVLARAEAAAAREGTTLAQFLERLVTARLGAHTVEPAAPRRMSVQEWLDALDRLGPASQEFEDAIYRARAEDEAAEAKQRARLDAVWAGKA